MIAIKGNIEVLDTVIMDFRIIIGLCKVLYPDVGYYFIQTKFIIATPEE